MQNLSITVTQAPSQVLRFGGKYILGRQEFCFYYMFKNFFSGHTKIWGSTKNKEELLPNAPRWLDLP